MDLHSLQSPKRVAVPVLVRDGKPCNPHSNGGHSQYGSLKSNQDMQSLNQGYFPSSVSGYAPSAMSGYGPSINQLSNASVLSNNNPHMPPSSSSSCINAGTQNHIPGMTFQSLNGAANNYNYALAMQQHAAANQRWSSW